MGQWEANTAYYSEEQVRGILESIGLDIISETWTDFLTYCPLHRNSDSPAFAVSKENGAWHCFNPSCNESGSLIDLVRKILRCDHFKAIRLISKHKKVGSIVKQVTDVLQKSKELPEFDQAKLDVLRQQCRNYPTGQQYWAGRGLNARTQEYFKLGYSVKQKMVSIPVHDIDGRPVGLAGRSVKGKTFKNSTGLPISRTMFNIHRAKRAGEQVIFVESSIDAMLIHQAGYPCVVASLGGTFSPVHVELIRKHFTSVIIMTDFDDSESYRVTSCKKCKPKTCRGHNPGRALGEKIAAALPEKRIKWAMYDDGIVYPHGAKDPGDCTEEEIKRCITNSVTNFEYHRQKKTFTHLSIV